MQLRLKQIARNSVQQVRYASKSNLSKAEISSILLKSSLACLKAPTRTDIGRIFDFACEENLDAKELFTNLQKKNLFNSELRESLLQFYIDRGKLSEANEVINKAASEDGLKFSDRFWELSVEVWGKTPSDKMHELIETLIKRQEPNWVALVEFWRSQRRFGQIIYHSKRIMSSSKSNERAYMTVILALTKAGDVKKVAGALRILRKNSIGLPPLFIEKNIRGTRSREIKEHLESYLESYDYVRSTPPILIGNQISSLYVETMFNDVTSRVANCKSEEEKAELRQTFIRLLDYSITYHRAFFPPIFVSYLQYFTPSETDWELCFLCMCISKRDFQLLEDLKPFLSSVSHPGLGVMLRTSSFHFESFEYHCHDIMRQYKETLLKSIEYEKYDVDIFLMLCFAHLQPQYCIGLLEVLQYGSERSLNSFIPTEFYSKLIVSYVGHFQELSRLIGFLDKERYEAALEEIKNLHSVDFLKQYDFNI